MSDLQRIQQGLRRLSQLAQKDPEWQAHLRRCAEVDQRVALAAAFKREKPAKKPDAKNRLREDQL